MQPQTTLISQGSNYRGYHCKIKISADQLLNGKITLEIESIKEATAYLYHLPNSFNTELSNTIGIIENNKINSLNAGGKASIPTDWSFYISYITLEGVSEIKLKSYVEDYDFTDIDTITNEWQPTGTMYIDPEVLAQQEREREEREEAER